MKNNDPIHSRFDDLLFLLVEDALDEEGIRYIENWLSSGNEAKQYYFNFIKDYVGMKHQANSMIDMNEETFSIHDAYDAELWSALAEVERISESIPDDNHADEEPPLIEKVERKRVIKKSNKFSIGALMASAAAILFIALFSKIVPTANIEVATLTSSIDAIFADDTSYPKGSRLSNQKDYIRLQKGVITVVFDYGAEVVIEAPSEFRLNSAGDMTLRSGHLYANVPGRSTGFAVETPTSQIIDLGTEFGVRVDFDGTCDVHMIKGKASLIPGAKGEAIGNSQIINANQAKHISLSGEVKDIPLKVTSFIRRIDEKTGFVWRGQGQLDLADIVGGGNGFGGGTLNKGIDAVTGKMISDLLDDTVKVGSAGYKTVDNSSLIDGVFVPGIEDGMTPITADGSISVKFPGTSGNYWGYIFNGAFHKGGKIPRHVLRLNGMLFGTPENPSISIHSNQGITFDLTKIRKSMSDMNIEKFRSLIGISETVEVYGEHSTADFWIFLDGRKVYEKQMFNSNKAVEVEIPITAKDQYLTLAVTEADGIWAFDWALFGRPELVIELTK